MRIPGIAVGGSCDLGQCENMELGAINEIVTGEEGFGSQDGLYGIVK